MRGPVTLINTATGRARARGVAWVNQLHHYAHEPRLVFDKATQLSKCPRVVLPPLAMPNRYPVTDAAQVFQGDSASGAFSLCNKTLTDDMVDVAHKAFFLTGALLQETLTSLRALGLQLRPQFSVTFSQPIDLTARIVLPIRVGGDIDDTKINPKKAVRLIGRWFWGIHHYSEVEHTVSQDKVCLPDLAVETSSLVSADASRDDLATGKSKDRNSIQPLPGKDTLVKHYSRVRRKFGQTRSVTLECLRNFTDSSNGHLRREFVGIPSILVHSFLESKFVSSAKAKRHFGNVITSLVEPFHRLEQSLVLLWARIELNYQGLVHCSSVTLLSNTVNG